MLFNLVAIRRTSVVLKAVCHSGVSICQQIWKRCYFQNYFAFLQCHLNQFGSGQGALQLFLELVKFMLTLLSFASSTTVVPWYIS